MEDREKTIKTLETRLSEIMDEAERIVVELLDLEATGPIWPACGVTFLHRALWPPGYHGDSGPRDLTVSWPIKDLSDRIVKPIDGELDMVDERYRPDPNLHDLIRGKSVVDQRTSERLSFRGSDPARQPKSERHAKAINFCSRYLKLESLRSRRISIWDAPALLRWLDASHPGWENADVLKETEDTGPVIEDF